MKKILLILLLITTGFNNLWSQTITVISPNGGESLSACQTNSISWSGIGTSGIYDVAYTIDNGLNWSSIATNLQALSFTWTIPNIQSTQVKIRVRDANNTTIQDLSDNFFTITAALILNTPNGGEVWQANTNQNITWTSNVIPTTTLLTIQYSTDGGNSWVTILTNAIAGNQTYSWPIPGTTVPSSFCMIRIFETAGGANGCKSDISNNVFSITAATPIITVTNPNTALLLPSCQTTNITWSYLYPPTNNAVKLEYTTDNGATWNLITGSTTGTSFSWAIPQTPSATCKVKATSLDNPSIFDVSNINFTIANPTITITAPNTAVIYYQHQTKNITWTSTNLLATATVNIELSIDGGTTWTTLFANTPNDGTQSWVIGTQTPSTTAIIRVSTNCNSVFSDISDMNFIIAAPPITVTAPNTATSLCVGSTTTISWSNTVTSLPPNVKIEYTTNNGSTWTTIIASTSNTGTYAWTIPNLPSGQCLVRVSDPLFPANSDVSNVFFTIPTVLTNITSPNGGETLIGCTSQNITIAKCGTTGSTKLEYSIDNGLTWALITTNLTALAYAWTVPNVSSTQCLIRATDLTLGVSDVSNAVFTIIPSIQVATPNGGEVYQVGGPNATISWIKNGTFTTTLRLDYSIDNGTNWTNITTVSNTTTSYNWTIPNTPSTQCLVRVYEGASPPACKIDQSNATFTISAATPIITVNSPNTNVIWYAGATTNNITWTYQYYPSNNVKLEYSYDNGVSWNTIIASTPNDGSHLWPQIPNTPSPNCLVRISDVNNSSIYDVSNVNFQIATPTITLTSPNGGNELLGCNTLPITWTNLGATNNVKIEASYDGGLTWNIVIASTINTGSYQWTIPNTVNSTNCFIKVSDVSLTYVSDQSNTPFSISNNSQILLYSANGGEVWTASSTQNISWLANGITGNLTIQYSTNNGTSWTNISTTLLATPGSYTWTVPNAPSTQALIRIFETLNACKLVQSNAVFTIAPRVPVINVTSPNTAVSWLIGSTNTVSWSITNGTIANVKLEYSINNGNTWSNIIFSTSGTAGAYNWIVPNAPSTFCLVRVSDATNASIYDVSNVNFTIYSTPQAITVTNPNGSDIVDGCTGTTINWNAVNCASSTYKLDYSTDNGNSWVNITPSLTQTANGACSYLWNPVPGSINSENCLVRVSNTANVLQVDQSDAVFAIRKPIVLIEPNLGGTYVAGSTMNISWLANGVSGFYNISYSTDNGTTWNPIVLNQSISSNSYQWVVPSTVTTQLKIRVAETGNSCKSDDSDISSVITVSPLVVVVTSPNGGEIWPSCSSQTITWTSTNVSGLYNLTYSINGGTTWSQIATNVAAGNTGSYLWNIPNSVSGNCLIRITDAASAANVDQSNAAFNITQSVPMTLTANTAICTGQSINLIAAGAGTYSWSPATGLSSTTIANPSAAPTTTTTYTVVGTLNGCSNTKTVKITVNPIPIVSINQNNVSFCSGVTLNANGASTYSWSPSNGLSNASIANPVATPMSSTLYTVTGSLNGCSASASVTVNPIPIITANASTNTICSGSTSNLSVTGATSYIWSPAIGLSSATISNPIASPTTSQTYTVTGVSNGCSSTASLSLTVNASPNLVASAGGGICAGASINLTATGATTYNWTPATGLSSSTIANPIATPISTTTYTVSGSNGTCTVVKNVTITVTPTPVITISGNPSICNGSSTVLTATGGSNYVWSPATGLNSPWLSSPTASPTSTTTYTVTSSVNGCQGSNNYTLVVTSTSSIVPSFTQVSPICLGAILLPLPTISNNNYITGSWSPALNSTTTTTYTFTPDAGQCASNGLMTIVVSPYPSSTINAGGATSFCQGSSVNLNANVGSGLTYQWLNNGSNIIGANTSIYNATTTGNYTVSVSNNYGCTTTSSPQIVTVNALPSSVITTAGPTSFCAGGSVVLNANTSTGLTYQWKKDGTDISGATASSYTATVAGSYTVVVTNSSNCSSTSNATIVTISTTPTVPSVVASGATIFCQGGSVTLTSSSSTGNQWYNNGTLILGATGSTYTATATGLYTVITTSGSCTSPISNAVTASVNSLPSSVITAAGPTSFCAGGSVVLNANTGAGLNYQWKKDGTDISGATASSYTATVAGSYTVVVTNSSNCSSTSNATIITISTTPTVPTVVASGGTNFCQGGSVTLTSSSSTGNQWYNNGTLISGATGSTYTATATGLYTVITTAGSCVSPISNAVTVTVNALPSSVITAAGPTSFCTGGSVVLNANTGTGLTFQWKKDGTNITGATTSSYTATIAGSYTVVVTNSSNCSSTSNATTVNVNNIPLTPTVVASGATIFCQGGSITLTSSSSTGNQWYNNGTLILGATASTYAAISSGLYTVITTTGSCASPISNGITVSVNSLPSSVITAAGPTSFCAGGSVVLNANTGTGLTYQWKKDGTDISGATASSYTATIAGSYTVVVTNSSNCSSTSNATTVTVNNTPSTPSVVASGVTAFCQNGSVSLTSSSTTGNQWYNNNTAISGATSSTYIATTSGTYTVIETTGTCSSPASNTITVTVNALPSSVITSAGPTSICAGGSVVLNANTGTGLTYQWNKDGTDISGATAASYTATVTGSYTVVVTNNSNCSSTSNATIVTVNNIPATPSISWNGTQFSTTATGVSYQWFLNGSAISGATSATYIPTSIGVYKLTVTANGCSSSSDNYTLVVTGIDPNNLSPYAAQVYPNPAKYDFAIKFGETPNVTLDIQLINNLGVVIKSIKTKRNFTMLKVNELPSGLYFIKIIGGAFNQVKKIEIIK